MTTEPEDRGAFIRCPNCGHINQNRVEICSACGVNIAGYLQHKEKIIAITHPSPGDSSRKEIGPVANKRRHNKPGKIIRSHPSFNIYAGFFLLAGLIIILTSALIGFGVQRRQIAMDAYYKQALACIDRHDVACAQTALRKVTTLGMHPNEFLPISLWVGEQRTLGYYFEGDMDQCRSSAQACLSAHPDSNTCERIFCSLSHRLLAEYQTQHMWREALKTVDAIEGYCPPISGREDLENNLYLSWYLELISDHRYIKAFGVNILRALHISK